MRSYDDLRSGCAEMLRNVRKKNGLSKAKIAALLYVDEHTWSRYETGASAPSVPDFVALFDTLQEDALKTVLDYLYPDVYAGEHPTACETRAACEHYVKYIASDRALREWRYIVAGRNGSNIEPQLQMFTMIDKLPMQYRLIVARLVDSLYDMADSRGELLGAEVVPDVELFRDGIKKAAAAVEAGRNSYTTSSDG